MCTLTGADPRGNAEHVGLSAASDEREGHGRVSGWRIASNSHLIEFGLSGKGQVMGIIAIRGVPRDNKGGTLLAAADLKTTCARWAWLRFWRIHLSSRKSSFGPEVPEKQTSGEE